MLTRSLSVSSSPWCLHPGHFPAWKSEAAAPGAGAREKKEVRGARGPPGPKNPFLSRSLNIEWPTRMARILFKIFQE